MHNALNFLLTLFLILGTSTTAPNANQEERGDTQSPSVQRNPVESSASQATSRRPDASIAGESGVRILPIRTMVAAVPVPLGRPSSEPSGNPAGLFHPVVGRFHRVGVSSGQANSEQRSQSASQHHAAQHSTPESTLQRQNVEDSARNGN